MSKTVIFGASGFLGTHLVERIYTGGNTDILAVARNESALVTLKEKFPRISIQVGDIADPWVVQKALVHAEEAHLLSAMKHVGLSETDVATCVKTNITGTKNVIDESIVRQLRLLMFISSDKAAQPSGVYGCTKKIGEKLMAEAQVINRYTKYRVVRYGNVLYSSGSVLCKWRDRMRNGEEVIVTDMDATRFFWPVSQALDLIFECAKSATGPTPYITSMKSIRIGALLEAMMDKYGKVPVKIIGLQPGENKHEVIAEGLPDSLHSIHYTKEEILEVI